MDVRRLVTLTAVRHEVTVEGRTLVVERPYSRKPRLLMGGTELPRDRYGNYVLSDDHGKQRTVAVDFDVRHLVPRLKIGEHRVLTVPPLPRAAWWLLAPVVILGLAGGALGAGLGIAAAMLSAQQLSPEAAGRSSRWPPASRSSPSCPTRVWSSSSAGYEPARPT